MQGNNKEEGGKRGREGGGGDTKRGQKEEKTRGGVFKYNVQKPQLKIHDKHTKILR